MTTPTTARDRNATSVHYPLPAYNTSYTARWTLKDYLSYTTLNRNVFNYTQISDWANWREWIQIIH